MTMVRITDWMAGFRKVSFTALLREFAGLSLSQAHLVTIEVTEGRAVEIAVEGEAKAREFSRRAKELGAISEVA